MTKTLTWRLCVSQTLSAAIASMAHRFRRKLGSSCGSRISKCFSVAMAMYGRKRKSYGSRRTTPYVKAPYKKRRYTRNLTASNTHTISAHNVLGYSPNSDGLISQCVRLRDVEGCPLFQQFTTRYAMFRVTSVSVKIVPVGDWNSEALLYSVLSRDDDTPLSTVNAALRNVSVMCHDMRQTQKTHSRYMKLQGPQMKEWLRCSESNAILSTGPYSQAIKVLTDNLQTTDAVKLYTTFTVEFKGLTDMTLSGN